MRERIDMGTGKHKHNNYDSVAPIYDALAGVAFGGSIGRAQLSLMPLLSDVRNCLIIGGGTGWFLTALLKQAPNARVLYIEKSPRMMRYSRELLQREMPECESRVDFRLDTDESLNESDGDFDLIVTNFFFSNFHTDTGARIAARLNERLATFGRWLFVDFEPPKQRFMRWYTTFVFRLMFLFFNIFSRIEARRLPDYERIFGGLGLHTHVSKRFYGGAIPVKLMSRVAVPQNLAQSA
jgi:ubiquinone/menaquinone biosynthesis C-methylase UbiE